MLKVMGSSSSINGTASITLDGTAEEINIVREMMNETMYAKSINEPTLQEPKP